MNVNDLEWLWTLGWRRAQSRRERHLALWLSCRPGEQATWLLGLHAQGHQASGLVLHLRAWLEARGAQAPGEAVERVEAVDARVVWGVVRMCAMTHQG